MRFTFSVFITLLLLVSCLPLNTALAAPGDSYNVYVQTLNQAGNYITSGQMETATADSNNQIAVTAPAVAGYNVVGSGVKDFDVSSVTSPSTQTIEAVFYYQSATPAPATGTIVLKDVTPVWTREAYDENGNHIAVEGSDYVLRSPVVISGLALDKTYDLNALRQEYESQPITALYPAAQPVGTQQTSVTLDALHSYVVVNDQYNVPRQLTRDLMPSTPPTPPKDANGAYTFRALVTTYDAASPTTLIGADPDGNATTTYYDMGTSVATKLYLDPYILDSGNNQSGTTQMYALSPTQTDPNLSTSTAQFVPAYGTSPAYIDVMMPQIGRAHV